MNDKDLKHSIESALDFEPSLDATDVGVSVDEGVVTLRGNVGTYAEKNTAERVALRVFGVKAVANDLVVHLPFGLQRTDTEIAQAALTALKWNTMIPEDRITLTVENGWITLNGTLDWQYQRDVVARTVRDLTGVKGVTNSIALKPHVKTSDVREKIEAAFKRSAEIDARRISVTAQDGKVTLSGSVHSWTERLAAEHAAWAAPGVTTVDDRLAITP
jgi:osmotically-inducible protein OsmY